jgi:hypothetical protein
VALTDTEIRKAKAQAKPYTMADGRGLYLSVTPTGGKLWRWGYTFLGKEKLMSFGRYPDVSLATARLRHSEARTLLADGIDPMAQRKALKSAQKLSSENSFARVASLWIEHWRLHKSEHYVDTIGRRMAADILPSLGERPVTDIKTPELVAMAKTIEIRGASDLEPVMNFTRSFERGCAA